MTPISGVSQISNQGKSSDSMPSGLNVFMLAALAQGTLINESMKKQVLISEKAKAARLIEGIVGSLQKHDTANAEKMKAQFEEILKNVRTDKLDVNLEMAGLKATNMLNEVINLKKKLDEAVKGAEKAREPYNEAKKNYDEAKKKVEDTQKLWDKYAAVPFYGPALGIKLLILKGKLNSAASKLHEKSENLSIKVAIANSYKNQMNERQGTLLSELSTTSKQLSIEAEQEMDSLQSIIDTAIYSIEIITGGK